MASDVCGGPMEARIEGAAEQRVQPLTELPRRCRGQVALERLPGCPDFDQGEVVGASELLQNVAALGTRPSVARILAEQRRGLRGVARHDIDMDDHCQRILACVERSGQRAKPSYVVVRGLFGYGAHLLSAPRRRDAGAGAIIAAARSAASRATISSLTREFGNPSRLA
jgi:hypothetical protein